MPILCDLFCRVVDNFGDAGVCWRLARQLAREHGWAVRMWIDDPAPLAGLRRGIDPSLPTQSVDGVEIRQWTPEFPEVQPGDVVIEAFGCELPASFVATMATCDRPPVWLNLEYLSAESWVSGCHGLPSPHPGLPLTKYFFFPGFVPGTGGLIRERDLVAASPRKETGELIVSLFCYETPALPALLETWAAGDERVICRLADGLPRQQVARWLERDIAPGSSVTRGNLTLNAQPFVPQAEFDRLLSNTDLNFVRGEDSFVRAQWAERPFVWQAYPQSGDAHFDKLDAFLARYLPAISPAWRTATADFYRAWNGSGDVAAAWAPFRAALPALTTAAGPWAERIASHGNLAENLVRFCRERL
jgi:uncharacterized repeat protein (TIGR03837 family)